MTQRATALFIIVGALLLWWAAPVGADQPETFEPGTGKYILVLDDPRTEVDDPAAGKKRAREPDVQKYGGKVLHKKDATRVIKLPTRAASALRKEENVAYLQRIWLGESREEWGEDAPGSSLKADAAPETLDTDLTWTTGTYLYDGSGNIKQIGTDTYRYDTLGRLTHAVVKGITETYQYDSFGNLIAKSVNGQARAIPVDSSSNRLQGEAYDAAGNVTTQSGQPRYHYDSLSMVDRWERPPSNRKRYIYGPDDERIGVVLQEGSFSRWKIRDFSGKVLREFKADDTQGYWEWIEDYAYADGRLLAAERESYYGGKRHFHTDQLGSVRMITDQSRKRIAVHDYSAFGVEQTDAAQGYNRYAGAGGGGDFRAEPMKFTSHERDQHGWLNVDNDDSLDYMHARYYDPNLGRFLSVDPSMDIKKNLPEPQRWNRYAYVTNNPLRYTDPDGRDRYQEPGFTKPLSEADWSDAPPVIQGAFYAQGALLAAGAAGGGAAGGLARGAFNLAPIARGWAIEAALAAKFGGGLPNNFPTIDRFLNGIATSVKSIDLLGKSYQNTARLTSVLTGYVDKIAQFNGGAVGQTAVRGGDVSRRVLELAIQRGVGTPQQMQAIRQAIEYARKYEIELRVILIK